MLTNSNKPSFDGPTYQTKSSFIKFLKVVAYAQCVFCTGIASYLITVSHRFSLDEETLNALGKGSFKSFVFQAISEHPLIYGVAFLIAAMFSVALTSALQKLDEVARNSIGEGAKDISRGWESSPMVFFLFGILVIGGVSVVSGLNMSKSINFRSFVILFSWLLVSFALYPLCLGMLTSLSVKMFRSVRLKEEIANVSPARTTSPKLATDVNFAIQGAFLLGCVLLIIAAHNFMNGYSIKNTALESEKLNTLSASYFINGFFWVILACSALGLASVTRKLRIVALRMKDVGLKGFYGWQWIPFALLAVCIAVCGIIMLVQGKVMNGIFVILIAAYPHCLSSLVSLCVEMYRAEIPVTP